MTYLPQVQYKFCNYALMYLMWSQHETLECSPFWAVCACLIAAEVRRELYHIIISYYIHVISSCATISAWKSCAAVLPCPDPTGSNRIDAELLSPHTTCISTGDCPRACPGPRLPSPPVDQSMSLLECATAATAP